MPKNLSPISKKEISTSSKDLSSGKKEIEDESDNLNIKELIDQKAN